MIKAIIFDFFGVLEQDGVSNRQLLDFIRIELKPKYKLAILSNSIGRWMDTILTPQEVGLFDEIVLSAEEGIAKPDPEIYQRAAARLGVTPQNCIYVDDDDFRVDGAKVTGMKVILYRDFSQVRRELEILLR